MAHTSLIIPFKLRNEENPGEYLHKFRGGCGSGGVDQKYRFSNGRVTANVALPKHFVVLCELPVAFVEESHLEQTENVFNPKFENRREMLMLCQLIAGNHNFAKTFASRYGPRDRRHCNDFYYNPRIKELGGKPAPGETASPYVSRWAAIISFLDRLGVDSKTLEWWRRGDRLEKLWVTVMHLSYRPPDIISNEPGKATGLWLGLSQIAHSCEDKQNCIQKYTMTRDPVEGVLPCMTVITTREIAAGEELTISHDPHGFCFGFIESTTLRARAETISGLLCYCDECELRRLNEKMLHERAKKTGFLSGKNKRKSKKTSKKKKNRRRRRNRNNRSGTNQNDNNRSGNNNVTVDNNSSVVNGVPVAQMTMAMPDGSSIAFDPIKLGNCFTLERLTELIKALDSRLTRLLGRRDDAIDEPDYDDRMSATRCAIELAIQRSFYFREPLKKYLTFSYENLDFRATLLILDLVRKCHMKLPGTLKWVLQDYYTVAGLCDMFRFSQRNAMTFIQPTAWWWAALNYRLHMHASTSPRRRIASCYHGIMTEIHFIQQDPESLSRLIGYFAMLTQQVEQTFGVPAALEIISTGLCNFVRRLKGANSASVLVDGQNNPTKMHDWLQVKYNQFCRQHNIDPNDGNTVIKITDASIPKFYPMPEEVAARAVQFRFRSRQLQENWKRERAARHIQFHVRSKQLRQQWLQTRETIVKGQVAIRACLQMRRQRKKYLDQLAQRRLVSLQQQVVRRTILQRAAKAKLARMLAKTVKRTMAATVLQSNARTWIQQKRKKQSRQAIVKAQTHCRTKQQQKKTNQTIAAIKATQAMARRNLQQLFLKAAAQAAAKKAAAEAAAAKKAAEAAAAKKAAEAAAAATKKAAAEAAKKAAAEAEAEAAGVCAFEEAKLRATIKKMQADELMRRAQLEDNLYLTEIEISKQQQSLNQIYYQLSLLHHHHNSISAQLNPNVTVQQHPPIIQPQPQGGYFCNGTYFPPPQPPLIISTLPQHHPNVGMPPQHPQAQHYSRVGMPPNKSYNKRKRKKTNKKKK